MTDGKAGSTKLKKLRAMGFGLGPPTPGGWNVSIREESNPTSPERQAPAREQGGPKPTREPEQDTAAPAPHEASQQFATRLQLLLTYRREIGKVAAATSFANSVGIFALLSEMAEASRQGNDADALASFSLDLICEDDDGGHHRISTSGPIYEQHHVTAIANRIKYNDAALRLLHETSVQQLVNSYERLLGDIARSHIFENTHVLGRARTLTYREILEFRSLDEVKRAVVEAETTNLIRNHDTTERLKWLREHVGADVRSQFPDIDAFRALELRRHAIVHAGGIATSEYRRRLKALGEDEVAAEGTPLLLSSEYIARAWDVVYALGIVTGHLASVARARALGDVEQQAIADGQLNTAAVWAIDQRRYEAAQTILEYARKRTLSRTMHQLMVLVNLAQTYKWQGRGKDCRDLLRSQDWEATSDGFRLCVAVLEDEDAEQYLVRAVRSGNITLAQLYEWPVFRKFRERDGFSATIERVFGPDARPPLEKIPASLLDFSHEDTLRELLRHLAELSKEGPEGENSGSSTDDETVH